MTIAFLGGRILTMADDHPEATGLVVRDGRIVAVGQAADLARDLPADAEIVDLAGRVVLPGFVDGHCHLELTTTHLEYAVQCFCPPHHGIADICATLAGAVALTPPDEWVVGRSNFNFPAWASDRRHITRHDLDRVSTDTPIVVFSGLHVTTMNSEALRVTGVLDGTARIPRGATIDVETGRATELWGWLPLPRYGVEATARAIRERGRAMFTARGVTSIAELPFTTDGIRALQLLRRRGQLPARVRLWIETPRFGTASNLVCSALETGFGDDWLSLGGVKLFVDGIGVDVHGDELFDVKWDQDELDETVRRVHEAGQQLWMHVAPTRAAAEMALTAVERATATSPRSDHRHRIEHIGDLAPETDLLDRIAAAGVIPVTTPQFIWSYGDLDPIGAACPLRTLHERGFRPPLNSDATGTQPEAANPWHGIWCALARRTRGGTHLRPDEAVTLAAAIRAYTRDAASACHLDDRGVLAPGRLADLVIMGADPWEVPVDDLPTVPIDDVVIGGVSAI